MKNFKSHDLLAIFLLAIFLLVFFFPVLFQNQIFVTNGMMESDLMNQNLPYKWVYSQALKQGQLPFWVAKMGNGFPLVAEGQVGAFYPLNLLFFYLLPPLLAFNFSLVFHYFLAGLFTYLLAHYQLKLSTVASFIAGLSFSFSGFLIIHLFHLSMIQTAVWLPLQFFLLEAVFKRPKYRQAILLGLVFGFQFLAGHSEIFYFSALFLGIYVVFRLFWRRSDRAVKNINKIVVVLVIGAVLALILSLPQFWTSWQLIGVSDRQEGYSFQEATKVPVLAKHLLAIVVPWRFDLIEEGYVLVENGWTTIWESYLYFGLLPLGLALVAILTRFKEEKVRLLIIWLGFSFLLALGRATPVFKILWDFVPGIQRFRYPTRLLLFTQFSLVVLTGFGADWLLSRFKKMKKKPLFKLGVFFLVAVIFLDLFLIQRRINPTASANQWLETLTTTQFLEDNLGHDRFFTYGASHLDYQTVVDLELQKSLRELLPGSFNLVFGIASANSQSAIFLDRHLKMQNQPPGIGLKYDQEGGFQAPDNLVKILSLRGVKYVLSALPLTHESLVLKKEVGLAGEIGHRVPQLEGGELMVPTKTIYLYENLWVLPRARMVYQVKKCLNCSDNQLLETLVSQDFDQTNQVLLEEAGGNQIDPQGEGEVEWLEDQDLRVNLRVNSKGNGLLVLSDNYYPAWQAYLDGQVTKIYQANFAFRAVFIPDGEHEVEFRYQVLK